MTTTATRLPTFLILGPPKCGTTTLHHFMQGRPDVFMPATKDPLFFELDEEYDRGPKFYRDFYFAEWNRQPLAGEARPTKLMLPYVAERIHETLPGVRLIAILRNPVERLFSHWWMRWCNGKEPLSLEEALARNEEALRCGRTFTGVEGRRAWKRHLDGDPSSAPVYLEFGYYAEQLARYLELFPASQIMILFFEDLRDQPARLFADLLGFLGAACGPPVAGNLMHNAALPIIIRPLLSLDHRIGLSRLIPDSVKATLKSLLSRSGVRARLDGETRSRLVEHYRSHNQALSRLTRRDLSHWMD